jgi:NADP-dependent aldehyde dehydrogenase
LIFIIRGEDSQAFKDRFRSDAAAFQEMTLLTTRIEESWREGVRSAIECGASCLSETRNGVGPVVLSVGSDCFKLRHEFTDETFGPSTIIVECSDIDDVHSCLRLISGSLTATLWCEEGESNVAAIFEDLETRAGRVVVNSVPTGVEVCDAMVHSGPFPASNRPDATAVGAFAIRRWCRPVAYQNVPQSLLPPALRDDNEFGILRLVEGEWEV